MSSLDIYCITNKEIKPLEQLDLKLVGVGKNNFPKNYIDVTKGDNIQFKEKFYSELTFHYWFWKNKIKEYDYDSWIGFCQKRRFWINSKNQIINFNDLKENILKEIPNEWEKFDVILCNPINVSGVKKIKIIKRGWRNLLKDPAILFDTNKHNLKLQFDMFHGYGIIEKAIEILNTKDKDNFRKYILEKNEFCPHIMFISKRKILEEYFESVFKWLFDCEKIFGFKKLKGYETGRLYAYLAERYSSYWFQNYYNVKYGDWTFFDMLKN